MVASCWSIVLFVECLCEFKFKFEFICLEFELELELERNRKGEIERNQTLSAHQYPKPGPRKPSPNLFPGPQLPSQHAAQFGLPFLPWRPSTHASSRAGPLPLARQQPGPTTPASPDARSTQPRPQPAFPTSVPHRLPPRPARQPAFAHRPRIAPLLPPRTRGPRPPASSSSHNRSRDPRPRSRRPSNHGRARPGHPPAFN